MLCSKFEADLKQRFTYEAWIWALTSTRFASYHPGLLKDSVSMSLACRAVLVYLLWALKEVLQRERSMNTLFLSVAYLYVLRTWFCEFAAIVERFRNGVYESLDHFVLTYPMVWPQVSGQFQKVYKYDKTSFYHLSTAFFIFRLLYVERIFPIQVVFLKVELVDCFI